jgi:hypothetical protein
MLFSSSPPPPLLRVNSLYTAKPPFTDSMVAAAPSGLRRLLLYPHTAVAVILLLQRFSFFL